MDSSKIYEVMMVRLDPLLDRCLVSLQRNIDIREEKGERRKQSTAPKKKTYFGEGTHGGLLLRYLIAAWLKVKYVIIRRFQGLIVCGSIV